MVLNRKTLINLVIGGLIFILLYALAVLELGSLFGYYDCNVLRTIRIHYYWAKWASSDSTQEEQKWIDALKREGLPAIKILKAHLHHKDLCWRAGAAKVLGKMKVREAVPDLIAATNDSNELVQWCSILALADIKDKSAVPALLELLDKDLDLSTRLDVLYALGKIGDRRAIPALIKVLRASPDNYTHLNQCAIASLEDLTGQYFGNRWFEGDEEVAERWIEWWEKEGKKELSSFQKDRAK